VEVKKEEWDGKQLNLELESQPEDWTLYVFRPESYENADLTVSKGEAKIAARGKVLEIAVKAGSPASLQLAFKKTNAAK
jgi:hypothetical protein